MRHYIFLFLLLGSPLLLTAQVKIGDNPGIIGSSSILELESTDKAFVLSRVNDTTAITSPSDGMFVFDETDDCIKMYRANAWSACLIDESNTVKKGTVSSIDCAGGIFSESSLVEDKTYDAATLEILYAGSTGGFYNGESVNSSGVSGLVLTIGAGGFYVGSGSVTYDFTGTANSDGTASFILNIGGQTCTLDIPVVKDLFQGSLTTNLASYNSANDGDWVAITASEYNALATNAEDLTKVGMDDANLQTGYLDNGCLTHCSIPYTSGYSSNPAPVNSYVFAFKILSGIQISGGDDFVKLSTENNLTGFVDYGGALPSGIVQSMTQHFVLKGPNTLQTSPVYLGCFTGHVEPAYINGSGVSGGYRYGNNSTPNANTNDYINMQALSTTTIQW